MMMKMQQWKVHMLHGYDVMSNLIPIVILIIM